MVTDPAKIQKFFDFDGAVGAALPLDLGPLRVAAREPDGLQTLPHFFIVQRSCTVAKAPKLPEMCPGCREMKSACKTLEYKSTFDSHTCLPTASIPKAPLDLTCVLRLSTAVGCHRAPFTASAAADGFGLIETPPSLGHIAPLQA